MAAFIGKFFTQLDGKVGMIEWIPVLNKLILSPLIDVFLECESGR